MKTFLHWLLCILGDHEYENQVEFRGIMNERWYIQKCKYCDKKTKGWKV